MLKTKKRFIAAISCFILFGLFIVPVLAARYVQNGHIQSWYQSLYLYDFDYSGAINYNSPGDGKITYADNLTFSNKKCNNSLAQGTFGCGIAVSQESKSISSTKTKVTYVIKVNVSAKTGIGTDIYMGTNRHIIEIISPGPTRTHDENNNKVQVRETENGFYYDPDAAKFYP